MTLIVSLRLRGWHFLGTNACFKQTALSLLALCQWEAVVIKAGLFSSLMHNPRSGEAHILYSIIIQRACCWLVPHAHLAPAISADCLLNNFLGDKILHQRWSKLVISIAKYLMAFAKREVWCNNVVNTNVSQHFMSPRVWEAELEAFFLGLSVYLKVRSQEMLRIHVRIA